MILSIELPSLNQLYVSKASIASTEAFLSLIDLYNLSIISSEEDYYILDGSDTDLADFRDWWSD